MGASSIDYIFTVSRDHIDEGRNALKKTSKLRSFFEKKTVFRFEVVRGCPVDGRQPDGLHIGGVTCDGSNDSIFTV